LALPQSQPLGNALLYAKIESLTGTRREAKPRQRPSNEPTHGRSIEGQRRCCEYFEAPFVLLILNAMIKFSLLRAAGEKGRLPSEKNHSHFALSLCRNLFVMDAWR
jgi:hypothetical protein